MNPFETTYNELATLAKDAESIASNYIKNSHVVETVINHIKELTAEGVTSFWLNGYLDTIVDKTTVNVFVKRKISEQLLLLLEDAGFKVDVIDCVSWYHLLSK